MRRLAVVAVAALALAAVPGVASADVIFDQADADELAATLKDAYDAQGVCYGWSVSVDNEGLPEQSDGSNFGAGTSVSEGSGCDRSVELQASISWTPESSEAEDSASYQVVSTPSGPTTADLDGLDLISENGLTGDDVDVDVYKAVAALPLLAADAGVASPIEASPAPESEAAGEAPTNTPGSDFWRESGMTLLWGVVLLLAAGVFAFYTLRTSRRGRRPVGPVAEQIPDTVPPEWTPPAAPAPEPSPEPAPGAPTEAPDREGPAARPDPEAKPGPEPGAEPPPGKPDPQTRPEG